LQTRVDEIAERIYRLSTYVPSPAGAAGLTFNQFLIDGDEPLLFHCGQRSLFASVSTAMAGVIDVQRLRWITFSHVEADECGALNDWLAAAPHATAAHGRIGCLTWLNEMAARPPRVLAHGERLDLGGKTVVHLDTPHIPHGLDAGLLHEETTGTLFCSDLFTHFGEVPVSSTGDIVGPAITTEKRFTFVPLTPDTGPALRRLAALSPRVLALMHGPAYVAEGTAPLHALAGHYDDQLRRALAGLTEQP
jgi:flavorubredoxin